MVELSGHPEFAQKRTHYYKDFNCILAVYDSGSRRSFESLGAWLREARSFSGEETLIFICENKV